MKVWLSIANDIAKVNLIVDMGRVLTSKLMVLYFRIHFLKLLHMLL